MAQQFNSIEAVMADLRRGKMVIVTDDADRENEGDVIAAAQIVAGGRLSARAPVRGTGDLRALNDSFNHMADALERSDR